MVYGRCETPTAQRIYFKGSMNLSGTGGGVVKLCGNLEVLVSMRASRKMTKSGCSLLYLHCLPIYD